MPPDTPPETTPGTRTDDSAGGPPAAADPAAADLADLVSDSDEFSVAVVGDEHGNPRVRMTFGHVHWLFTPDQADQLGGVLIDGAAQARTQPTTGHGSS